MFFKYTSQVALSTIAIFNSPTKGLNEGCCVGVICSEAHWFGWCDGYSGQKGGRGGPTTEGRVKSRDCEEIAAFGLVPMTA